MSLLNHPLYRAACRGVLRREARRGNAEAAKVLNHDEAFDLFADGLPDQAADEPGIAVLGAAAVVGAVGADGPIIAAIKELIAWVLANPDKLIAFIMMIVKLFGL